MLTYNTNKNVNCSIMAKTSVKSKARDYFRNHPKVSLAEFTKLFDEVLPSTVAKYHIEFRQLYGKKKRNVPDEISIKLLEKELSQQLENNPTAAVIKSCIEFLKLKAISNVDTDELDMKKFIKIGKSLQ